jgi:hypothetical protein
MTAYLKGRKLHQGSAFCLVNASGLLVFDRINLFLWGRKMNQNYLRKNGYFRKNCFHQRNDCRKTNCPDSGTVNSSAFLYSCLIHFWEEAYMKVCHSLLGE